MKQHTTSVWIGAVACIIVAFLVLQPLTHTGFFISDDGEWMVIRLSAFYQSLAEGQFPVRLLGRLNNSFGYPVANFLYPGFLYLGSLLHLVGFSFVDSVKLIMGGSIVGSAVFIYLFLRKKFSTFASLFGVTSFIGAAYLVYDVYHRGSVGEVLAFLPASMLLYATSIGAVWLIAPAVAFLIVSHNSLALILGSALGVYMLLQKNRVRYFWHGVLGVCIASFFWMPALFERSLTIFDTVTIANPLDYFVSHTSWGLLGIPTLVALLCAVWAYKKIPKELGFPIGVVVLSYFFALPLSTLVWNYASFSELVQFPYRFLALSVLFGPWIVAWVCEHYHAWKKWLFLFVMYGFLLYGIYTVVSRIDFIERTIGYYTTNEDTTTVHDEYLPRWAPASPQSRAHKPIEFISGEVTVTVHKADTQSFSLSVEANEPSVLQINKIYYPGWGVTVDNVLVPIEWQNPQGLMQIAVPTGTHVVAAAFRETVPRFIADIVTLVGIVIYGWIAITRRRAR